LGGVPRPKNRSPFGQAMKMAAGGTGAGYHEAGGEVGETGKQKPVGTGGENKTPQGRGGGNQTREGY